MCAIKVPELTLDPVSEEMIEFNSSLRSFLQELSRPREGECSRQRNRRARRATRRLLSYIF